MSPGVILLSICSSPIPDVPFSLLIAPTLRKEDPWGHPNRRHGAKPRAPPGTSGFPQGDLQGQSRVDPGDFCARATERGDRGTQPLGEARAEREEHVALDGKTRRRTVVNLRIL